MEDNSDRSTQPMALRPDVVVTVTDEGAVLLDLDSKYFYSVNNIGWELVQQFELGAAPRHLVESCRESGAPAESEPEIQAFLDTLLEDGLLEPAEAEGPVEISVDGAWQAPTIEKHREPLQRVMTSAFDPTLPLAE